MAQPSPNQVSAATETTGASWRLSRSSVANLQSRQIGNRAGAAVLLVIAAPAITLMALLIRLTSPGPALFRQVRLGQGGRRFVIFKLRTMVNGAESMRPDSWTGTDDPRVTAVGAILRRWHLDELPQLFNVVRGDMTLVGPRPERPEIADRLRRLIPNYEQRLEVRPGIVGLAQINLPPDCDVDSVRRKLLLDLEYIRTATLGLDFRMLVWSFLRLVGVPFSLATRALALERSVDLDALPFRGNDAAAAPAASVSRHTDAA